VTRHCCNAAWLVSNGLVLLQATSARYKPANKDILIVVPPKVAPVQKRGKKVLSNESTEGKNVKAKQAD
jgi:hypothetical protein